MNWIPVALAALLTAIIAFGAGSIVVHRLEEKQEKALTDQISADGQRCIAAQNITKEANDEIQTDHKRITARAAVSRVQRPATCVPVTGTAKLSADREQHAGQDGLAAQALRNYAAEAEGYRSEVNTCIKFLTEERALKK